MKGDTCNWNLISTLLQVHITWTPQKIIEELTEKVCVGMHFLSFSDQWLIKRYTELIQMNKEASTVVWLYRNIF